MRQCPAIVGIKFDNRSQKAIEEINEIYDLKKIGRFALFMGQIYSIFGGSLMRGASGTGVSGVMKVVPNGVIKKTMAQTGKALASESNQTSYNIFQTNWQYFFDSFGAFDKIALEAIEKIAYREAGLHQTSHKEYLFWKSIYLGCEPYVK